MINDKYKMKIRKSFEIIASGLKKKEVIIELNRLADKYKESYFTIRKYAELYLNYASKKEIIRYSKINEELNKELRIDEKKLPFMCFEFYLIYHKDIDAIWFFTSENNISYKDLLEYAETFYEKTREKRKKYEEIKGHYSEKTNEKIKASSRYAFDVVINSNGRFESINEIADKFIMPYDEFIWLSKLYYDTFAQEKDKIKYDNLLETCNLEDEKKKFYLIYLPIYEKIIKTDDNETIYELFEYFNREETKYYMNVYNRIFPSVEDNTKLEFQYKKYKKYKVEKKDVERETIKRRENLALIPISVETIKHFLSSEIDSPNKYCRLQKMELGTFQKYLYIVKKYRLKLFAQYRVKINKNKENTIC